MWFQQKNEHQPLCGGASGIVDSKTAGIASGPVFLFALILCSFIPSVLSEVDLPSAKPVPQIMLPVHAIPLATNELETIGIVDQELVPHFEISDEWIVVEHLPAILCILAVGMGFYPTQKRKRLRPGPASSPRAPPCSGLTPVCP